MPDLRPFRFGVVARTADSRAAWIDKVQTVERLGYSVLLAPDHFGAQLAPLVALMAAAEASSTLRIGTFVLSAGYRHPAVLHKEIATLDLLSGGRLEWGIGAGWHREEYEQAGIPFETPGMRVERLEEAVRVVKGLFAPEPFSFTGTHYVVAGLSGGPPPVQRPYPPLLIGGGSRRVLSLAAREADIVGFAPQFIDGVGNVRSMTAEAVDEQVAWVREAAGARFAGLELNILLQTVIVTDDRRAAAQTLAADWELTPAEALASPHALIGTVEQIAADVRARRDRDGISYLSVFEQDMQAFAPVARELAGQ